MRRIEITGGGLFDTTYEVDIPEIGGNISWNVTRGLQDARSGRFGPTHTEPWGSGTDYTNLDKSKVRLFRKLPDVLAIPGLVVGVMDLKGENQHNIIIDGNHRQAARLLNGVDMITYWLIPPELEGEYRVTIKVIED